MRNIIEGFLMLDRFTTSRPARSTRSMVNSTDLSLAEYPDTCATVPKHHQLAA